MATTKKLTRIFAEENQSRLRESLRWQSTRPTKAWAGDLRDTGSSCTAGLGFSPADFPVEICISDEVRKFYGIEDPTAKQTFFTYTYCYVNAPGQLHRDAVATGYPDVVNLLTILDIPDINTWYYTHHFPEFQVYRVGVLCLDQLQIITNYEWDFLGEDPGFRNGQEAEETLARGKGGPALIFKGGKIPAFMR